MANKERRLNAMMPAQILRKGYTITRNLHGDILRSIKHIHRNEAIETHFADGHARSIVQETEDVGYGP